MSANIRIAELLRARAEIDMKLAELYESLEREKPREEAPVWLKIKEFCERHGISDSVVRRYIKQGMPHKELGPRTIRINAAAAEAWLEDQGHAYRSRARAS